MSPIRLTNQKNQKIYSLSFTIFGKEKLSIHIGNLQGASDNVENRQAIIKTLTRTNHGLRPKGLVLEVLYLLSDIWNVNSITAISNNGHIYQSRRYIGSKKQACDFNYNTFWTEYNGSLLDTFTYKLPQYPPRKDLEILSASKRSLYTKRYAWLEDLKSMIEHKILSSSKNTH